MVELTLYGPRKYLTGDPQEVFTVKKGTVYVYVVCIEVSEPGRTFFVCEVPEGGVLPAFSVQNTEDGSRFEFLLAGKDRAEVEVTTENSADLDRIRNEFLDKYTTLRQDNDPNKRFSQLLGEFFESRIKCEHDKIEKTGVLKQKAIRNKMGLMASIFDTVGKIHYDEDTGSLLYNTMSVYCDYMNIRIIPYSSLFAAFGDSFSVYDIARSSHFVLRKIKLGKKWYKKDAGAFVAKYKETGDPVLCIPKGIDAYIAYDLAAGNNYVIEKEEADRFDEEAYIAYQPLPGGKLTRNDIMKYGFSRVRIRDLVIFFVMALLSTFIGMLLPVLNEQLFDNLIPIGNISDIMQIGVVIFAVMIGNVFFGLVQNLSNFRAVKSMEYAIVSATYDRLFRLPLSFIEKFGTTEMVSRVNSVSTVFSTTVGAGASAAVGFVLSLFYLFKMFDKSKTLAWRGLIMAGITALIMYGFGRARIRHERKMLESSTKSSNMLYQFLAGILKIKVSGIENRSLYEYQKVNTETMKYMMRSTTLSNIGNVVTSVASVVYTGVIFYTVIRKKQVLTIGEYTAFNSAYGMFTSAVTSLVTFFITRASLVPVMERIQPIFDQEIEVKEAAALPGKLTGAIEVDHLDFAYDDEETKVLRDITFKVSPGEFIGIVGSSGCGKSTLLKCLLGFEKPTKGKIFYDNKDVDTLDKCEMRKQLGVVLQDGKMVVGNIFSNVTLAAPNMKPAEVEDLLEEVGLRSDIEKMPMGIFTAVSEGGGTLSGGQQQRVLIARALANNPSIIYFDEATSALDNITQQMVCERLEKRNMTRVMIAHRLSTVRDCDRIFVMDKGAIVEEGNYDTLMAKKGLFYELVKRQELKIT
ncbi:MAG: NHLP bacteriocin export ABC transporter permease/ATPase subunit [Lachnospiraceae bacterium]|nr:NHLP bacteriocin export ABC transporter permease/ATPase subunit [Lachnospiraceae bacterium]